MTAVDRAIAARKPNRQQKAILAALDDRLWHESPELNAICFRYGGRIHELRGMGYEIEGECVTRGLWRYRLVAPPLNPQLEAAKERTERVVSELRGGDGRESCAAGPTSGGSPPAVTGNQGSVSRVHLSGPGRITQGRTRGDRQAASPSPSRWQDRVGVSGAARKTGGVQTTLWEE